MVVEEGGGNILGLHLHLGVGKERVSGNEE
jgi:hypothetical protein